MINVISFSDLIDFKPATSINLGIVRTLKNPIVNVRQFEYLAPSQEALDYWNKSCKDKEHWENYKKQFQYELEQDFARIGLQIVLCLAKDCDVNLMCYCRDPMHCHRSLVAEKLCSMGGDVNLFIR